MSNMFLLLSFRPLKSSLSSEVNSTGIVGLFFFWFSAYFQMIHRCDLSSEERNFEGIARDGLRVPDGAGDVVCPGPG